MPADALVGAYLLGRKLVRGVDAPRAGGCRQAELGVLAGAHNQFGARGNLPQCGAITEAAIAGDHQNLGLAASLIERCAQLRHTADEALREIAALAVGPILFPGLRVGALARFFHGGDFFKTNRNGAGRKFAAAMQGQQQRALQETQSQDQIGMKRPVLRIRVSSTATPTSRPGHQLSPSFSSGANRAWGSHLARECKKYSADQLCCSRPLVHRMRERVARPSTKSAPRAWRWARGSRRRWQKTVRHCRVSARKAARD